jgi:hypothetical protein
MLLGSDQEPYGQFVALSSDGSFAFVRGDSGVHVLLREHSVWREEATLAASDDRSLGPVAPSGDGSRVLAGSGNSAHVFVRDGATWTDARLVAPDG